MARITHRETYILRLLNVRKEISDRIDTEIGEIFHDRGMSSEAFKETLIDFIKDEFSRMNYRNENKKEDIVNKLRKMCMNRNKCDECPLYELVGAGKCVFADNEQRG